MTSASTSLPRRARAMVLMTAPWFHQEPGISRKASCSERMASIFLRASAGWSAFRSASAAASAAGAGHSMRLSVEIGSVIYQVRDIRAVGDGSEMRAKLTRL